MIEGSATLSLLVWGTYNIHLVSYAASKLFTATIQDDYLLERGCGLTGPRPTKQTGFIKVFRGSTGADQGNNKGRKREETQRGASNTQPRGTRRSGRALKRRSRTFRNSVKQQTERGSAQVVSISHVVSVWNVPHTHSKTTTAFACIFQCFFCQQVQQSCSSPSPSPEPSEEQADREMVKMTKSKTFQAYLPNCHRTYSCIHCRAHLANHDELISKSFQGSQGRAYLFNSVVNVGCGPAEERVLLTGLHAVADIYCENCKTTLGWKYEHAFESSQKYKEGKFIIELAHMIKDNGWE
ncbi:protein yippee-like 1-like [Arapaima gigas]